MNDLIGRIMHWKRKRSGQGTNVRRKANTALPIFATSSYVFDSAEQASLRFTGKQPGNIYSRFTNPTVSAFQERLALMEQGERCVAFASGMAAIMAVGMALLKAGDHVVCSRSVFGNTVMLFQNYFGKFGVADRFCQPDRSGGLGSRHQAQYPLSVFGNAVQPFD